MIAACPKCDARYRVDESKIGSDGARLRCAKCQAVFRVRPPAAPAPAVTVPPQPVAATTDPPVGPPIAEQTAPAAVEQHAAPPPAPQPTAAAAQASPAEPEAAATAEPQYDRQRLVLVADPKDDTGKWTVGALSSWGLQSILVQDGVEAMLAIQRTLPRVIILDAALPKMYGFQVCEIVKRNESLKDISVILVGAIHNRNRYRRPPVDLYGADAYLEQPDLPDGLRQHLVQWGLPVTDDAATHAGPPSHTSETRLEAPHEIQHAPAAISDPIVQAPSAVPEPSAPTASAPSPVAPRQADDGLDEERQQAERLARIVVSDIVLYQGEKFEQAIRSGNLLEALDSEIEEGRNFFRQRINEQVRDECDHLLEELMRVAKERGMQ